MNKIRLWMLGAICLLLSLIPLIMTSQVWASAPQQATGTAAQMQAVQAAISLLLTDDEENQVFLPLVAR